MKLLRRFANLCPDENLYRVDIASLKAGALTAAFCEIMSPGRNVPSFLDKKYRVTQFRTMSYYSNPFVSRHLLL